MLWRHTLTAGLLAFAASSAHAALAPGQAWVDEGMSGWLKNLLNEPVNDGNRVEFYVDGTEFFPVRLEMIRRATRTIDVSTFLWCDDEAGLAVANELARAHRDRGVRVRVMIDFHNNKTHDKVYSILRSIGAEPLVFNPPWWGIDKLNDHSPHEKVMIVDGHEALVGGANLCDEYMIGGPRGLWHDLEQRVEGPILGSLQPKYDETWNWMATQDFFARSSYSALDTSRPLPRRVFRLYPEATAFDASPAGPARAMLFWQRTYQHPDHEAKFKYAVAELIKRARRKLVLYIPYYVPPRQVEDAILGQARKGLDVTVVTNAPEMNDVGLIVKASQPHLDRALNAGVKVREHFTRTLHAKAILLDDEVVSIGSHNLTNRSFSENGEANILTGDPDVVAKFLRMVENDKSATHELDTKTLHKRMSTVTGGVGTIVGHWLRGLF